MKQTTSGFNRVAAAALMLALPTAYFITINILKGFGINGPYDAAEPLLERAGIKESLGLEYKPADTFWSCTGYCPYYFPGIKIPASFYQTKFSVLFECTKKSNYSVLQK